MPEVLSIALAVVFGIVVIGGLLMVIEFALYVPGLNKPEPVLGKILDKLEISFRKKSNS